MMQYMSHINGGVCSTGFGHEEIATRNLTDPYNILHMNTDNNTK